MCRRINIFVPVLFLTYILASICVGYVLRTTGIALPVWGSYLLSQGILLFPAVLYVLVSKINIIKCIPYRKLRLVDGLLSLLVGYTLIPTMLFVSNLTSLFSHNYLQDSMSELLTYPFIVQLLIIAVLPAFVEEFIFRGLLYHSYRKNGILGAALVSGLVFGLMHLNINQLSYAVLMGAVFALLVEATGSMFSSMLAHLAVNSYSIIMLKLVSLVSGGSALENTGASLRDFPAPVIIIQLMMLLVMAIGFLGLAFLLFKKIADRNGRWNYLTAQLRKGVKPQNGEHFITAPLVVTVIAAVAYMLYIEMF